MLNLWQVPTELTQRLKSIFLKDEMGRRPRFGSALAIKPAGPLMASVIQLLGWSTADANLATHIRRSFAPRAAASVASVSDT
jgi:hypothetical protein